MSSNEATGDMLEKSDSGAYNSQYMQLSPEKIQELKGLLEKEYKREFTWEEASKTAHNLAGYVEMCFKVWKEDECRKKKLEESPKGFKLDGSGYTCFICGAGTRIGENWYDKYGIKCTICQGAIDRKEIPPSLAKNKESWSSKSELERCFNIKAPVLRRWIKDGILKVRTITHDGKGVHEQLFLIRDNKDMLPPKKLVKDRTVRVTKDGQDWFHMEPWYRFVDPHEHLKGYKIMDYLRVTHGEENKSEKS